MRWKVGEAVKLDLSAIKRDFETILRWCDRGGEEPEGLCLHEIENICRRQLGLELLRPALPAITTVYRTCDVMPECHQLVIVEGGCAVWTGSVWLSKIDDNRVIWCPVSWWMPIPRTADLIEQQSMSDLAASGGIVDAP